MREGEGGRQKEGEREGSGEGRGGAPPATGKKKKIKSAKCCSQLPPGARAGDQHVVAVADRADKVLICDGAVGRDAVIKRDAGRERKGQVGSVRVGVDRDRGVDPPVAGNAGEGVVGEVPSRGGRRVGGEHARVCKGMREEKGSAASTGCDRHWMALSCFCGEGKKRTQDSA